VAGQAIEKELTASPVKRTGYEGCVCPNAIAQALGVSKGAVRCPIRRISSTDGGLQRSELVRASHSGINLCETGAE